MKIIITIQRKSNYEIKPVSRVDEILFRRISSDPLLLLLFHLPPFSTGTPLFCRNEPAGTRTRVSFYGHLCQERHNVLTRDKRDETRIQRGLVWEYSRDKGSSTHLRHVSLELLFFPVNSRCCLNSSRILRSSKRFTLHRIINYIERSYLYRPIYGKRPTRPFSGNN